MPPSPRVSVSISTSTCHERARRFNRTGPTFTGESSVRFADKMSGKMPEEKGKGISLRKNKKRSDKSKKGGPPVISAPRQISAPMPVGLSATTLSSAQNSGRVSNESSRSGQRQDAPRPRERPQRPGQDKTADLVKRRYSQKITQLPSDFGNGMPMPDLPQIPAQFREAPPSRDGRPPGGSEERSFRPDRRLLADDNLKPDQCKYIHFGVKVPFVWITRHPLTVPSCQPTARRCLRGRYPPLPGRASQAQEPQLDRSAAQRIPKSHTVHEDQ